ncbi:MAG: hypothetical protein ABH863_03390 [Candidatus Micrarchaeota archaeon]
MMGRTFLMLLVASLLGYSLSIIGVPGKPIDSFWKLFALVVAISILAGWLYPYLRGIRKDDQLVAVIARQVAHGQMVHNHLDSVPVVALKGGWMGQKIHVRMHNGKRAEGIVSSYAGTFSPATIRLTESEV